MTQHRKDKNEKQIVDELRNKYNIFVFQSSSFGNGFPDIVIPYNGFNYFIEIKFDKSSKLTPAQKRFRNDFKDGQYAVAHTTQEVLKIIGYEQSYTNTTIPNNSVSS
jgi:hypothetical protein